MFVQAFITTSVEAFTIAIKRVEMPSLGFKRTAYTF